MGELRSLLPPVVVWQSEIEPAQCTTERNMRHRDALAKTRNCVFERVEGSVYHLRLARDPGGRALCLSSLAFKPDRYPGIENAVREGLPSQRQPTRRPTCRHQSRCRQLVQILANEWAVVERATVLKNQTWHLA